ncbi:MAG: hypothetical protein KHY25_06500, partial [Veillonella sp.]|uniref:hypothetical protein n=2 Tax=Veillonella sp. TaxID=1926307 RepID=UPI001EB3A794
VSLGGSFLFYKNFLPTPSLTGGFVMPIRRTIKKIASDLAAHNLLCIYYSMTKLLKPMQLRFTISGPFY